jgi:YebC/PmpR family DNA-binding regulatory protein
MEGVSYEEASFEGYGPAGVAMFIDALTDNRNRTVAEIRHALTKHGGSLGEGGCVAWMFEMRGLITIPRNGRSEDEMLEIVLECGGDDLAVEDDVFEVTTRGTELFQVKQALEQRSIPVGSAELVRIAQNTVRVEGKDAELVIRLVETLEELDDVQRVSANFDIPEELMRSLGG